MVILEVSCLSARLFPADEGSDRWFGMKMHYRVHPYSLPFILEFCQANENNQTNILQRDTIPSMHITCTQCYLTYGSVWVNYSGVIRDLSWHQAWYYNQFSNSLCKHETLTFIALEKKRKEKKGFDDDSSDTMKPWNYGPLPTSPDKL